MAQNDSKKLFQRKAQAFSLFSLTTFSKAIRTQVEAILDFTRGLVEVLSGFSSSFQANVIRRPSKHY